MSCDSRLPICCSGDLQWSHYGLPDSEASLPRPWLPLLSSPFPVSSLFFPLSLSSLSSLPLPYTALLGSCVFVCMRVLHPEGEQGDREGRKGEKRERGVRVQF